MIYLKQKLDTKSCFFGFIIGFCLYLFFSHLILDKFVFTHSAPTSPLHDEDINIHMDTTHTNKGWTVPWVDYRNIEQIVNSKQFPSESNKPPKPVHDSKKDDIAMQRKKDQFYGGGDVDEKHLGGWKFNDSNTYESELWDWVIDRFNITSVMDIGCGVGCSTIYFKKHPRIKRALCVEGSIDAVENSLVPDITVHHDYTLGPYWPGEVFDMVWSAEFLEHVKEEYIPNVMATFKAAKRLLVTHSSWGGWHHVNVHHSEWWIYQFETFGFSYQDKITEEAREQCPLLGTDFKDGPNSWHDLHTDGNRKNSHFHFRGLVLFNKLFMNRLTEYDMKVLNLLQKH
eukprot:8505_1